MNRLQDDTAIYRGMDIMLHRVLLIGSIASFVLMHAFVLYELNALQETKPAVVAVASE
jgi:hypothetical protein